MTPYYVSPGYHMVFWNKSAVSKTSHYWIYTGWYCKCLVLCSWQHCTYSECKDVRKSKDPGITQVIWLSYKELQHNYNIIYLQTECTWCTTGRSVTLSGAHVRLQWKIDVECGSRSTISNNTWANRWFQNV